MISLKSFLFLTHALCVPGVYLCCEQSEMSVKAYHNTYLGQIVEKIQCNVFSLFKVLLFTYCQTCHLQFPTHRHGAPGFLKEIGGLRLFL